MKQIDVYISTIQCVAELTQEEKDNFCDLLQESRCDTVAQATFSHVMNTVHMRRGNNEFSSDSRD